MKRLALALGCAALALLPLADGGQTPPRPALKPLPATPALLPYAPQSDERWVPIERVKKEAPPLAERFEKRTRTNTLGETMPYRLFRPQTEPGKRYPLVLVLHGASSSGTDNEKSLQKGGWFTALSWALPENQQKHPCFILVPQSDVNWPPVKLIPGQLPEVLPGLGAGARQAVEILEELLEKEPVDRVRLYVTGHSMGGAGTWNLITYRPDLFAAAVPVAGRAYLPDLKAAAKVPTWVFHGEKDAVEPVSSAREAVAALQAAGGAPLLTLYPEVEHNSFMWVYTEPALVEWLFAQHR